MTLPGWLLSPLGFVFQRVARSRLARSLPVETADQAARRMRTLYAAPTIPAGYGPGLQLVMHLMAWDFALYAAALEAGLPEEQAGALVEEVSWELLRHPISISFSASQLYSRALPARVRWLLDAMFNLVFTHPFRREARSKDGLSFDVVACPLAIYFKDRQVPKLTRHAACSLDFRMARRWGMGFTRMQTIASGAPFCDFRFQVPARSEPGLAAVHPSFTDTEKGV